MQQKTLGVVLAAGLCAIHVSAQTAASSETQVKQLVQDFRTAEQNYDVPALTRLISEQYVEISPAGEVDAHDRFLNFYTPDKKVDWPPSTVSEETVRILQDTAVDVLKYTYTMPAPGGGTRSMHIRASYVAQRGPDGWKLIGAQFTGIRPPAAAAK